MEEQDRIVVQWDKHSIYLEHKKLVTSSLSLADAISAGKAELARHINKCIRSIVCATKIQFYFFLINYCSKINSSGL